MVLRYICLFTPSTDILLSFYGFPLLHPFVLTYNYFYLMIICIKPVHIYISPSVKKNQINCKTYRSQD